MNALIRTGILACGFTFLCASGCKTEINNPPPQQGTTVIHEDHDVPVQQNTQPPQVENKINVDH